MNPMEIVKFYNEDGMSLSAIGTKIGKSKSTVLRILVKAGYTFNKSTGKYETNVSRETINSDNNIINQENNSNNVDNNVSCKTIKKDKLVNRTYSIPEKIDKALKIKAVIEGKDAVEIVREALRSFIEDKYFNMY